MNDAKLVNIARLVKTYNLEIEQLPDNLKCAQCKFVLKEACQLSCCCRYCRVCIDDMMARGDRFCPGGLEECGESALSCFVSDYALNKRVSRLIVKCPHDGCMHKCRLANIEEHLRECQKKSEECSFRELGCTQDKLAAEEMGGNLQHKNHRHSEILIELIANINKEIETLKWRDEASSREIDTLKHELALKDEQIKSIMDQMIHLQNENKSIKEEKEDLAGRVRILTEQIQHEIAERCGNDELDSARVIEHTVTQLIGIKKDDLATEIQSVRCDIGSISQGVESLKNDICSVKSKMESIQTLTGLGQFDASCVWLLNVNVGTTEYSGDRLSEYFTGAVHPYRYRLASFNNIRSTVNPVLRIQLLMNAGPNDGQLAWPFEARVVVTVTDRDRREACRSVSMQCRIERLPDNDWRGSDYFMFLHSELIKAGLNLSRGVCVSCVIVPVPVDDVIDSTFHSAT